MKFQVEPVQTSSQLWLPLAGSWCQAGVPVTRHAMPTARSASQNSTLAKVKRRGKVQEERGEEKIELHEQEAPDLFVCQVKAIDGSKKKDYQDVEQFE